MPVGSLLGGEHTDSAWTSLDDLTRYDFARAVREEMAAYRG